MFAHELKWPWTQDKRPHGWFTENGCDRFGPLPDALAHQQRLVPESVQDEKQLATINARSSPGCSHPGRLARAVSIPVRSGGAVRETAGVSAKSAKPAKPAEQAPRSLTPEEAAAEALLGRARAAEARRYSMLDPYRKGGA